MSAQRKVMLVLEDRMESEEEELLDASEWEKYEWGITKLRKEGVSVVNYSFWLLF